MLIRDAEALERFEAVDTLVVDKTGTLTEGKPRLTAIDAIARLLGRRGLAPGREPRAVERASDRRGDRRRGAAEAPEALPSPAISSAFPAAASPASSRGARSRSARARSSPSAARTPLPLAARAEALRREGATVVFVALDGAPAALIAVSDPIKAGAAEALAELRRRGLSVVMLTGDNRFTAAAVAAKLGLQIFEAEVRPEGKAEVVARLKSEGRVVAMAGDGVNDAPALAAADVGVAMGTGTDAAIESAGITLLEGRSQGARPRAKTVGRDHAQRPAEPRLRLPLQRRRRADRGGRPLSGVRDPAVADRRGGGDVALLGQRHRQRAEAEKGRAVSRDPR